MNKQEILNNLNIKSFYDSYHPHPIKWSETGWGQTLCHKHKDHKPSGFIDYETGVFHCKGCGYKASIFDYYMDRHNVDFPTAKSELSKLAGLSKEPQRKLVKAYDYLNESGKLIFQCLRYEPKGFNQRRPDPSNQGKWIYNLEDIKLIPYNLPEVIKPENKDIFIVEGEKDVESLQSIGLVASCNPMGAGKWKPEYNQYSTGKRVVIIPDNDEAGCNHALQVAKNLKDIAEVVKVVELSGLPDKGDVSNWIQTGGNKEKLIEIVKASPEWQPPKEIEVIDDKESKNKGNGNNPYSIDDDGCLYRYKKVQDGVIPVKLCNFDAQITEEIIEDNGIETIHNYGIEGKIKDRRLSKIEVPASSFNHLNWLHRWGNLTILEPGQSTKDYVRHAIQTRSNGIKRVTCYTHTGWREINNNWCYLSGSGAIGTDNITVKLSKELQRYSLPLILESEIEAIKISLSFLDIGKWEITLPLFALLYLSPLTTLLESMPNFSGYLYGETGVFKTAMAILLLSFFGQFNSITNLSNFDDTSNALTKRAFTLKDTLLIIDDFHPSNKRMDAQQMESLAQKIIRACSNRTGRHRLNPDATDKGAYEPRGMVLITGEELVSLQSTLARVMVIEISKGDIYKNKLTEIQLKAQLLPHAMTSYISWVRENIKEIKKSFPKQFIQLRDRAFREDAHKKLPEQVAYLQFALDTAISWMVDKFVLSENEATSLSKAGWGIFMELSNKQSQRIEREDPIERFREILQTIITQGRVKIEHKEEYKKEIIGGEMGELIGYYDDLYTYLLPPALWHSLQKYCNAEGSHFPFSRNTFYRMLKNRGLIETSGDKTSITMKIKGEVMRVLKLIDRGICGKGVTECVTKRQG